jgi:hypothetical protein
MQPDARLYKGAMEIAVDARALLRELRQLKTITDPIGFAHPHGPVVSEAVFAAIDSSGLERSLDDFETTLYQTLPDVKGEHDQELLSRSLDSGFVQFHGNADVEAYVDLREMAAKAGFDWHSYEVGIGASGYEILVSFGTSLAASAVFEFVRKLVEKELSPEISELAAVDLCKFDALRRLGPSLDFDIAFARPATVAHARYEVYLHVVGEDWISILLVRPNGEICGRKEVSLKLSGPP